MLFAGRRQRLKESGKHERGSRISCTHYCRLNWAIADYIHGGMRALNREAHSPLHSSVLTEDGEPTLRFHEPPTGVGGEVRPVCDIGLHSALVSIV